jgi:hypothetical protein
MVGRTNTEQLQESSAPEMWGSYTLPGHGPNGVGLCCGGTHPKLRERLPSRHFVNKGKTKGRGLEQPRPCIGAAPLEQRYFWGAGQSSGAGGCSIGTRGRCDSAVSLSPALSLAAHWPAGMNSWMNANAGAAVMVSINAETKAAASKTENFLLNNTSL